MIASRYYLTLLAAFIALTPGLLPGAAAEGPDPAEAMMKRMRETLRNTMIQLQTAQAETAALQAKQAESEAKIQELETKLTATIKQADADKANAGNIAKEQEAKMANQAQELAVLNETLSKWKVGYKQAAQVANSTEGKRAKLADKVIMLERQVADQRVKNRELYDLGKEILTRYEKFGFGTALVRREPFTGIARVKFETLIQEYGDKLVDGRIPPDELKKEGVTAEAKPAAASTPAPAPAKPESKPSPVKAKS
jgi:hypothetical protein